MTDTLDAMAGELEEGAERGDVCARNLQTTAAAIKDAEEQMAKRRKAIENRAKHLLEYVQDAWKPQKCRRSNAHFRLAIQAKPPSVDVYEPGLLPVEYMRTPEPPPPAPDKTAIAATIKAGKEVPGAAGARHTACNQLTPHQFPAPAGFLRLPDWLHRLRDDKAARSATSGYHAPG